MKKVFWAVGLLCVIFIFSGCADFGIGLRPVNPWEPPPADRPCTIYADLGVTTGVIFQRVKNPCAAQNLLIIVAQEGAILDAYQIDEFKKWSAEAQKYIASGITYDTLKLYIMGEVMKLNRKVGLSLFAISGLIEIFSGQAVLDPGDVKLCIASLQDLDKKVEQLRPFL